VVGAGDAGDVLVGQLAVRMVHHPPELAGVNEEHLAAAVTVGAGLKPAPVAHQEPQARRDLRRVEELSW